METLNLYVYDKSMRLISIIDSYSSLIWTDRYDDCGDFEIAFPYSEEAEEYLEVLKKDCYCGIDYSLRKMIIEKIEYEYSEDGASTIIVSGRSLESILARRIILGKTEFGTDSSETNLQNGIKTILNQNVISPSDPKRAIQNFIFQESEDEKITSLTFSESYNGEDVYSIISELCKDKKIGFKITFNNNNEFVFELFAGDDHSYDQQTNPVIVFSPYYDNLKNSNFYTSTEEFKNVMLISVDESTTISASNITPEPEGLERREILVDKNDLKTNQSSNLSTKRLQVKAQKKLKNEYDVKTGFDAEIVPDVLYRYGEDYDIGDIVQLIDIFNNNEKLRISEVAITCDDNGFNIIPTFTELEEDE